MMEKGQAPGADDISADVLKLGGEDVVQWLLNLACVIWEEENVAED